MAFDAPRQSRHCARCRNADAGARRERLFGGVHQARYGLYGGEVIVQRRRNPLAQQFLSRFVERQHFDFCTAKIDAEADLIQGIDADDETWRAEGEVEEPAIGAR